MTKRIVLCADDYGQAPPISEAIISLLEKKRLTAVSCMVNTPFWPEHARWLHPYQESIDIGLHFNLTEGHPLSEAYGHGFSSLSNLIGSVLLRNMSVSTVAAELLAQLKAFKLAMGRWPDFIDGHQHIHQFPVIRDALLLVHQTNLKDCCPYIRLVNPKLKATDVLFDPKKVIIHLLGAHALKKGLSTLNIPHNSSFSGIYGFSRAAAYERLFPNFLQESADQGLIMCHPGLASTGKTDPIASARMYEFQYLASDRFLVDSQEVKYTQLHLSMGSVVSSV